MTHNLEIKARIPNIQAAEAIAQSLPATFIEHLNQIDTYFRVQHGRLKLREINQTKAELIYYNREEFSHQRISNFTILPCHDVVMMKSVFQSALGILYTVQKRRTLYMYNSTRIHLDEVTDLGCFMELETPIIELDSDGRAVTDFLIGKFEIKDSDYITCSYLDLVQAKSQEVIMS